MYALISSSDPAYVYMYVAYMYNSQSARIEFTILHELISTSQPARAVFKFTSLHVLIFTLHSARADIKYKVCTCWYQVD